MRLQVYLAQCGVASRRKSEELISSGRVTVNGAVVDRQGVQVEESDTVAVDGRAVRPESRMVHLALNKPRGHVCTSSDPQGRPTVLDLVKQAHSERLYSVGRLDLLTSGLIFITNDGAFADAVMHPSSEVEKEYLVESAGPIDDEVLRKLVQGATLDGVLHRVTRYSRRTDRKVHLVLQEGRNREIRKLFDHHGLYIRRIHRVRIGAVELGSLQSGEFRPLRPAEVTWFMRRT